MTSSLDRINAARATTPIAPQSAETTSSPAPEQLPHAGSFMSAVPAASESAEQAPVQPDEELPAQREIVLSASNMPQAEQQRKALAERGIRILSRKNLAALGMVLSTFKVPPEQDMNALLEELQLQYNEQDVEPNRRYSLLFADKKTYAQALSKIATPSSCHAAISLAMIDSAVNAELPFFSRERLQVVDVTGQIDSIRQHPHGTAVASLLVADNDYFPGILPAAHVTAINVFAANANGDAETRTDWLLYGFNHLFTLKPLPLAVNLSFGGGYSDLMQKVIAKLSEKMILVAAAGNQGSQTLVYPAAYTQVYAVGAVDAKGRKTRSSNDGPHVQILAPGEDIWASNGQGEGVYVSGTSYAAPFATAALALARAKQWSLPDYIGGLKERMISFEHLCDPATVKPE